MSKSRLIILIIFLGSLRGLSQVSDTSFTTPSSDTAYWNTILEALLMQNNPYAVLQIGEAKKLESGAIRKAQYLISDTILLQHHDAIMGDTFSKKRKVKKSDIPLLKDSLMTLDFSSAERALYHIRTIHNFLPLIKDKELLFLCLDSLISVATDPYFKLHILEEKKRFATLFKRKDKLFEVNNALTAFHLEQKIQYDQFNKELIHSLSKKKEPLDTNLPEVNSNQSSFNSLHAILLGIIGILCFIVFFLLIKYKKKNAAVTKSSEEQTAFQEELGLKQKQLIFSDQTIRDLKRKLEELELQDQNLQLVQKELQEELKAQIDKVIKTPDVASIMELKNILSRNSNR